MSLWRLLVSESVVSGRYVNLGPWVNLSFYITGLGEVHSRWLWICSTLSIRRLQRSMALDSRGRVRVPIWREHARKKMMVATRREGA